MPAPAPRASSSTPMPRRRRRGVRAVSCGPTSSWDFGLSATCVKAEITESQLGQPRQPDRPAFVTAISLPTSPGAARRCGTVAYNWATDAVDSRGYLRFTFAARRLVVHAARRPGAELRPDLGLARATAGLRASHRSRCRRDPNASRKHPIVRCRAAVVRNRQPALGRAAPIAGKPALFVNNLWDERAFLSVDRERGRSAAWVI